MSDGLGGLLVVMETVFSSFISFDILKSLRCRLLDGNFLVEGDREQSKHLSEVTSSLFRKVLPHSRQLPWLSSETKRMTLSRSL